MIIGTIAFFYGPTLFFSGTIAFSVGSIGLFHGTDAFLSGSTPFFPGPDVFPDGTIEFLSGTSVFFNGTDAFFCGIGRNTPIWAQVVLKPFNTVSIPPFKIKSSSSSPARSIVVANQR